MEIPRYWRTEELRLTDWGVGTVTTFTKISYDGVETPLAIVKLPDGESLTAQLTDFDHEPKIGEKVECVTRKYYADGERGLIVYGYKFRPILQTGSSKSSR